MNLDDLDGPTFKLANVVRFARDPIGFWQRCEHFGDPFRLLFPSTPPALVTWHPDGVREVFMAPQDLIGVYGKDMLEPAVGPASLLVLDGERHKRERKRLAPAFHGERMTAYATLISETTEAHLAKVPRGDAFDARSLTESISLEVIVKAVFGVNDDAHVARTSRTVTAAMAAVTPLIVFVRAARKDLGRFSPGGKLARAQAEADVLLQEIVDSRRAEKARGGEARTDILSMVLDLVDDNGATLPDAELKDELRTMLAAGHETTATALAWCLFFVLRDPRVLRELLAELAPLGTDPDPIALSRLPYLGAVCQEALRIRPITADVLRIAKKPMIVRGVQVDAGHPIVVALPLTQRLPELYPEPDTFRPERFLERKFSPYEYLPFGGGVRRCLGAEFAMFEMKIVLGALLARAKFTLTDPAPIASRLRNVTVGPARPIRLSVAA